MFNITETFPKKVASRIQASVLGLPDYEFRIVKIHDDDTVDISVDIEDGEALKLYHQIVIDIQKQTRYL